MVNRVHNVKTSFYYLTKRFNFFLPTLFLDLHFCALAHSTKCFATICINKNSKIYMNTEIYILVPLVHSHCQWVILVRVKPFSHTLMPSFFSSEIGSLGNTAVLVRSFCFLDMYMYCTLFLCSFFYFSVMVCKF